MGFNSIDAEVLELAENICFRKSFEIFRILFEHDQGKPIPDIEIYKLMYANILSIQRTVKVARENLLRFAEDRVNYELSSYGNGEVLMVSFFKNSKKFDYTLLAEALERFVNYFVEEGAKECKNLELVILDMRNFPNFKPRSKRASGIAIDDFLFHLNRLSKKVRKMGVGYVMASTDLKFDKELSNFKLTF